MTPSQSMGSQYLTQLKAKLSRDNVTLAIILILLTLTMALFVLGPLVSMLQKSVQDTQGNYVGMANFAEYLTSPALWQSLQNTVTIGLIVTLSVGILAFGYAYALTRSCMPFKGVFTVLGAAPILAPSLLPAISLIYLFGNQASPKSYYWDNRFMVQSVLR